MGLHKTGKGQWQVTYTLHGSQKTVYLGKKYDSRSAAKIEATILELANCRYRNSNPAPPLVGRLRDLPANVARSLRRQGLLVGPMSRTLGELAGEHKKSKLELKPSSRLYYDIYRQKLLKWFGDKADISEITPDDCREFLKVESATQNPCTMTSLHKAVGNVFTFAVERDWIVRNPFKGLVVRSDHNEETEFYVTRAMFERATGFAKTDARRFALILARFAGLRIPSEIRMMRFGDFKRDTFTVHEDTKTGSREVPFFHELREPFGRLRYGKKDSDFVFPRRIVGERCLRHYFRRKIIESEIDVCGLGPGVPWPKFFVNLRSSCITDYADLGYSEKALDAIFGNSERIRKRHYIQLRKRNEYRKILDDNAAILDLLREHGGNAEDPADFEFRLRKIFFRNFLVNIARPENSGSVAASIFEDGFKREAGNR